MLYSVVSFSPLFNDFIDVKILRLLIGLLGLTYIFGWVLLVGLKVNHIIDRDLKTNKLILSGAALICFLGYAQLQMVGAGIDINIPIWMEPIITLSTFASIIYLFVTTAKLIQKAEQKSKPQSKSYLVTAFMLFIIPIGIWIIQPRLNKIKEEYK